MLTQRITRYAAAHGISLPVLTDNHVREGLAGTLRIEPEIPFLVRSDIQGRLGPGLDVGALLGGQIRAGVRPGDGHWEAVRAFARGAARPPRCALVLTTPSWRFVMLPVKGGFLVIEALYQNAGAEAPLPEPLLYARFRHGTIAGFDGDTILRAVAARVQVMGLARRVDPIERADRAFLLPYQRYLEALRDRLRNLSSTVAYELVSRKPIRLEVRGEDEGWPLPFSLPRAQVDLPRLGGGMCRLDVAEVDDERLVLTLHGEDDRDEPIAEQGHARLASALGPLRRMLEALEALAEGRHAEHVQLLDTLVRPDELPAFELAAAAFPRLGARGPENDAQHRAVALALASPDLCVIDGPPGTGKTTVICEIIRNLVARRERVLLVAPTHVALDHVLQRIGDEAGIFALRLGWPDTVDERAHRFLVDRRGASLCERLRGSLDVALDGTDPADPVVAAQRGWHDAIEHDAKLGDMLLLNANLVCATPIGIAMVPAFRDPEPIFDALIMDEASKATVPELLVPATRARRWIVVGDHLQLAPYSDLAEIRAIAAQRAERGEADADDEQIEDLAWTLRRHFEQRMHPSDRIRQRVREDLLAAAFPGEAENVITRLATVPDDQWRDLADSHLQSGELPAALEGAPLTDEAAFYPRARLLAEMLDMQDVAMRSAFELIRGIPELASRRVSLDCQHRMHPQLAEFSRRCVYGPQNLGYKSASHTASLGLPIPGLEAPAIWIDTAWAEAADRYEHPRDNQWDSGEYVNPLEADVAAEVVERCIAWAERSYRGERRYDDPFEIGVITFYLSQARKLIDALSSLYRPGKSQWRGPAHRRTAAGGVIDVHVSLVDRFQGQEKHVIILSGTRSNPMHRRGHVNNLNRLNVAVTRAHHKRIVVGDTSTLARRGNKERPPGDLLRELLADCEHKQAWGKRIGRRPGAERQ
ncbi:AAA domain-containing protein [Sorangium sp. So ce693]|uniref:AAA domain-containing protein n=1 Tax=Sorangium sp. So ce693 TaxID=3133318 RepID=UPI003F61AAE5